ncbi:MAG: cell cycle transcriptional regulator TrcR [Rhodospirillales bacterium]
MNVPLMPKATAVWLVENTALTFEQIADFCGLHALEVQAIADGEVAIGMQGMDPIANGELSQEEIDRCSANPRAKLKILKPVNPAPKARTKGARYTPVSKRQDRPDAIAWLLKNYPELSDGQIAKLLGTTKNTINAIRERTHWNMPNIKPQNPVGMGLCSGEEFERIIKVARRRAENAAKRAAKEKAQQDALAGTSADSLDTPDAPESTAPPATAPSFVPQGGTAGD